MGRIADALARAERQREQTTPSGAAAETKTPNRWSGWYGAAQQPVRESTATEVLWLSPGPPAPGMAEEIVTYYDRSSMVSEQYRSLRTRLLSANPNHEHRLYAISSAVHKEGKSVTVLNLGFSFAEIRHLRTLVIDADFRHSSLAAMLNTDPVPGLADLLRDEVACEDAIRTTPAPNLRFVPAGRIRGRPAAELFSTRLARAAFNRFQKDYHYVLVDTPPVTTVADVGIMGQMMSGVIFVIRMHRTPELLARRALKHLTQNNIPIIGSVVIGDNDPSGGYGQHYGLRRYCRHDGH